MICRKRYKIGFFGKEIKSKSKMNHLILFPRFGQFIQEFPDYISSTKLVNTFDPSSIVVLSNGEISTNYKLVYPEPFEEQNYVKVEYSVGKNKVLEKGRIISSNGKEIELMENGQRKRIVNYKSLSKKDEDKAEIFWENGKNMELSFTFTGITWRVNYNLLIEENFGKMNAIVEIKNNTGYTFNIDKLSLMAGNPNKPTPHGPLLYAAKSIPEKHNDEYIEYILQNISISKYKPILLFTKYINIERVYRHDLNTNNQVIFGFNFKAQTHYPEGNVTVYKTENSKMGMYLGSDSIQDTAKGKEINLSIGTTSKVQVESILTRQTISSKKHKEDITIEAKIVNNTAKSICMILELYIGHGNLNFIPKPTKLQNNMAEFKIVVKPNEIYHFQGHGLLYG